VSSATTAQAPSAMTGPSAAPPRLRLPKIAFVVSQFPETHETFILREFDALSQLGLDFVILSLKPCRDKVVQTAARRFLDRTYYPFGARSASAFGFPLSAAWRTSRMLPWLSTPADCAYISWAANRFATVARDLGVGHIHAHWATAPTSAAAVMSRILGVPYSFTAHAWDIYRGDGRLAEKARAARFVVTCTAANVLTLRRSVPREDWDKVILNYHGIPHSAGCACVHDFSDAARPLPIAAVGRLVETKGYEYLLDALAAVDFPFELTIIGEGPLRAKLQESASRARLAGRVRFLGALPNEAVFSVLGVSDCFAMPSVIARDGDRDGIPNVVLEAMSVGLPVVASAISGIPEAIIDGETGILVPERDPYAIASALSRLYSNRDDARAMGSRGRDLIARKFSAETNASALYSIFASFLAGAS
jgi:colanic acid/amylovoran biosynthesis glycosyltransferase